MKITALVKYCSKINSNNEIVVIDFSRYIMSLNTGVFTNDEYK